MMKQSNLINKIYAKCPVFLQNIAISLYAVKLYKQRYTGKYQKYLKFYKSRRHKSLKNEKKIQNRKFLKILDFAYNNSPFYKEFYKDVDINQIKSVEDIDKLPILTKELIKSNIERIYTCRTMDGIKFYTGGTTGSPLMVLKRRQDVQKRMAYLDAYKASFGFENNKMSSARFFGKNIIMGLPKNHIYWRKNYIFRQRLYSTYYLQEENLKYYVEDLNQFRPNAIDGFPSAIYIVAKYILENKIELSFIPKAVFTTSETLLPIYKKTIEEAFQCVVTDQYASNEGAPFIIQCKHGAYHEAIDTGVFEHIDSEYGMKLLVTGFDTYGTPLIRYDIGDFIITAANHSCDCNSTHPVIGGIVGRDSNYIKTCNGRISQSQLSVLISELPNDIKEMQFIQTALNCIKVEIVISHSANEETIKRILLDKLVMFLGQEIEYKISFTNAIKRSKSGKFQLIVNQMEGEALC